MPYIHKISHNLKKVAERQGVSVVFSAPCKLASLCARIGNEGRTRGACKINHVKPFIECKTGVVYRIPLACGKVYIGQTGRCVNRRLQEHSTSLSGDQGSNLAVHCRTCQKFKKALPMFDRVTILGRRKTRYEREILAFHIGNQKDNCVSDTCLCLTNKRVGKKEIKLTLMHVSWEE